MTSRVDTNLKQWQVVAKKKNSSFAITAIDGESAYNNQGGTGAIVGSLPAAKPGFGPYYFLVVAAQTLTVTPKSTDNIRGKAAGVSYSSATAGNLLKLLCIITGTWEIEVNIGFA